MSQFKTMLSSRLLGKNSEKQLFWFLSHKIPFSQLMTHVCVKYVYK